MPRSRANFFDTRKPTVNVDVEDKTGELLSTLNTLIDGLIPLPADETPKSEGMNGSIGSQSRYAREDHQHPRISRSGVAYTDASGNFSITWDKPIETNVPVYTCIAVNTGTQPITINITSATKQGVTGKAFQSRFLPSTLLSLAALVNFNLYINPAANVPIHIIGLPSTF